MEIFKKRIYELEQSNLYEEIIDYIETVIQPSLWTMTKEDYFYYQFKKVVHYTNIKQYDLCFDLVKLLVNNGMPCPLEIGWSRFDPLRSLHEYHKLVKDNKKLIDLLNQKSNMIYQVDFPSDFTPDKKYPLFISLHGDGSGSNIQEFSSYWPSQPFIDLGFIHVYIQSSQLLYFNNYGWLNDPIKANDDILSCFNEIRLEYPIDLSQVIIGGFSGGSITAIDIVMRNTIPAKGFLSICPVLIPESVTKENIELAVSRGVKGVMMEGELALPVLNEAIMLNQFKEQLLPYLYLVNENTAHAVPSDFNVKIDKSISFLVTK